MRCWKHLPLPPGYRIHQIIVKNGDDVKQNGAWDSQERSQQIEIRKESKILYGKWNLSAERGKGRFASKQDSRVKTPKIAPFSSVWRFASKQECREIRACGDLRLKRDWLYKANLFGQDVYGDLRLNKI
ncbi:hypothetical protein IAD21_03705 [Abditibacteriota bacterium]|nr:hypothetical protein IAD21_03705 [Abditibacteriota bacterium]